MKHNPGVPATTVWSDTFETATGWTTNPGGTDTATVGSWERGDPEATTSSGTKQLGTTVNGVNDLVTGRLAGPSAGVYDIDGGLTSVRSPAAPGHLVVVCPPLSCWRRLRCSVEHGTGTCPISYSSPRPSSPSVTC